MPTTVTFQQGAGYGSTRDVNLFQKSPSSGGDNAILQVDGGTGTNIQTLLAFDNLWGDGPGQIPFGAIITSATLTLYTTNESTNAGSLYRMTTGWNEQSTWNSLVGGVQIGAETVGSADLVVGSVSTGLRSFDVTASLLGWVGSASDAAAANQANQGWLFSAGSTNGWDFRSSESSSAPRLTVTYSLASEASSQLALGGPVSAAEGSASAPTEFSFTVSRSGDVGSVVSVSYAVTATGAGAATFADFSGGVLPSGTVTFAAGETSKVITIRVVGDTSLEANESFQLTLSGATGGALITSGSATGTILNDDAGTAVRGVNLFAGSSFGVPGGSGAQALGTPDPTGLAYDPVSGRYFIVDSEMDETPFFGSLNLVEMNGHGQRVANSAMTSFTTEPTGVAAWTAADGTQRLFIADDNVKRVFQIDPANPGAVISSFSTTSFGADDPEDISINPVNGNLFILSENDRRIYEVTQAGKLVSMVQLPATFVPIADPNAQDSGAEGLAYDPVRDVFYVGGGFSTDIFVVSRAGLVIDVIDVLGQYPHADGLRVYPKGLTLAPSSDGSGKLSLWVADYGRDQVADGRIIEIKLDQPANAPLPVKQTLTGTSSANTLNATSNDNWTVDGAGGNDVITTLAGNDRITGSSGNDQINAGAGDDVVRFSGSGHGFDAVDGGAGIDRIEAAAKDTVIGLSSLSGVELITSNGFASVTISGTSAADVLDFTSVTLVGISSIKGGSGDDEIHGSAVKDTIVGGSGADRLWGNGGSDVFDFNSVAESSVAASDRIFDFQVGKDKIDLKTIDAVSTTTGDQAFKFIGSAAFSGVAGQLRADTSDPAQTVVSGDINGDGVADFAIILVGPIQLQSGDFIL